MNTVPVTPRRYNILNSKLTTLLMWHVRPVETGVINGQTQLSHNGFYGTVLD